MMDSTGHGVVAEQTHVRLLVKAPDQQIDDHTVECTLDWTVARLKDHLAQVYPSKPKREEQKIIYSGHLLSDSMILKDVLQQYYNREESLFIVHLVCGGQTKISSSSSSSQIGKSSMSVNSTSGQQSASVPPTNSNIQPNPVQQYYSQLNNQQMAWMQQAYAHYLTRYMEIMAAQGIQLQSTPLYTEPLNINASASEMMNNNNATTNNNNNNNNFDDNEDEAIILGGGGGGGGGGLFVRAEGLPAGQQIDGDPPNLANNNNNNNNINNNNNVPVEEGGGGAAVNRDWLDIFDMLSRIVVLSSIVYFYSSPSRFLIVTFLGFAIYLIQGGFFRGQPAFLADNNNARVADNNNQNGQNDAGQQQQQQQPAAAIPAVPAAQQAPRIPTEIPLTGEQQQNGGQQAPRNSTEIPLIGEQQQNGGQQTPRNPTEIPLIGEQQQNGGQQAPRNPTEIPLIGEQQQNGGQQATRTNLNEENERPGAWAFTWTFFSSFFASLIPDQPNVI